MDSLVQTVRQHPRFPELSQTIGQNNAMSGLLNQTITSMRPSMEPSMRLSMGPMGLSMRPSMGHVVKSPGILPYIDNIKK